MAQHPICGILGEVPVDFRMPIVVLAFLLFSVSAMCQTPNAGLLCHDTLRSYRGYTLFAPEASRFTYLIDNHGRVVHTWESAFPPGKAVTLRSDGVLVRTALQISQWMLGGGAGGLVEMFDWEGNKVWSYNHLMPTARQHHDVEALPNGNVLLLIRESFKRDVVLAAGRLPERLTENALWSERVVEVKPTGPTSGEIVWSWSTMDHLIQDVDSTKPNYGIVEDHPERVNINSGHTRADWLHANSVRYNAKRDEVMISVRDLGEIWIISKKTGDIVYRYGNPLNYKSGAITEQVLFGQHDARWVEGDDRRVTIFNNGTLRPGGKASSVDEIVLPRNPDGTYHREHRRAFLPASPKVIYPASLSKDFFAGNISGAARYPNDRTLICLGPVGTFIEIASGGEEVWKYVNPFANEKAVSGGVSSRRNMVFRIERYSAEYPAFHGKNLGP